MDVLSAQRVLVVDDDEDIRFLIRCWLATSDRYEVVAEAGSGAEAIEAARRLLPDLAVMDVNLPNGDGEEATSILGSLSPRTKVLAYSASIDRSFVLGMIGAGADGYLVKTGHLHELVDALDTIADGDIYLSDSIRRHLFEHVRTSIRGERTRALPLDRDHHVVDLALRDDNLQIAHQPIVDLHAHDIVGFEALARFPHTDGPGPVFEAAARTERSAELELMAARHALESAHALRENGQFLSINASPSVITNPEFEALLADSDHASIVVELTEQAPVRDYHRLNVALDRLRRHGARLAVDDVGGGFACLTHVHRLLPDIIKIDRYLIDGIHQDSTRRSMVTALVSIARDIGASVIAEGIELPGELRCVQDLGIRFGQGFLLGAPTIGPPTTSRQHMPPQLSQVPPTAPMARSALRPSRNDHRGGPVTSTE